MTPEEWASRKRVAGPSPLPRAENAAPQRLMENCQGLVRSLAWKIHRKLPLHVELEDLVSFGQVGLAEAARNFDPGRGRKFITYAYYRVRGAIFDGLSKMSWFSRHDYHASRYARMANEVLDLQGNEAPDPGSANLEDEVRWFKGVTGSLAMVYLATSRSSAQEPEAWPIVDESRPSPSAQTLEWEVQERLFQLINALPSDAGTLIRGVYFEGLTLREAGEKLGISKGWASRLHAKTLHRLAHSLRLIGLGE